VPTNIAWACLLAAGLLEIGFTYSLKRAVETRSTWWNASYLLIATASFVLLAWAAATIPMGTAYAVWTGIGASGTAFIGWLVFDERMTLGKVVLLTVVLAAVIGLRLAD
jgi:quaternary ammonium compound-resistance protein SugE